jgi:hypothetical protein
MKQNLTIFWNWLVWSSKDPNKLALTVKGAVPYILIMLTWKGIYVEGDSLNQFVDMSINGIVALVQFVTAVMTVYGAGRKIHTTIKRNSGI